VTVRRDDVEAAGLAALLLTAGVGHFTAPRYVRSLVPSWIPAPRTAVAATGLVDIAVGAMVARRSTRGKGAAAATALMAVYLGTHVDASRRAGAQAGHWLDRPTGVLVRIATNALYIGWADRVRRRDAQLPPVGKATGSATRAG
jgi:uncharacterized membrane protein